MFYSTQAKNHLEELIKGRFINEEKFYKRGSLFCVLSLFDRLEFITEVAKAHQTSDTKQ